ncbi:DUF4097 family beta strand repeat-containing protein [Gemelliphila palaticanis]|uniref:DUF4097 family beta strand repeat protein n=1 Tax=Gemelliphila palaticanis TaxID=81950 RepID=A0ABX2SXR9_9BACL|nr:DUF4097 family beta strand repeat-containing protein [Gemella palaticanis]MBF0714813.1 DUF4097 family beta strand repeat protein [Gemella palaticanis]NYS46743.1 DUF4097 family beta strand repeat protein [Gemella palaticanis]
MKNNTYVYEENIYDNIQDIKISTDSNNIIIKEHTENFIKIRYDKEKNPNLKISTNNNFLEVKQQSKSVINIVKLFVKSMYSDIYIYLPNKIFNLYLLDINGNIDCNISELENIKVDNVNGNNYLEINKISSLKINNGNGNVTLKDMVAKELEINNLNGNIKSNLDANYVDIKNVNGNVTLNFADSIDNYNIVENTVMSQKNINNNALKNINIKNVNGSSSLNFG